MKVLKVSALALVFGLMSFSPALTNNEPTTVKVQQAKTVTWKAESLDLGEIPQGKPKDMTFEFVNTSKADVIITNVKPACGCTAADYTKTPVKAGEKGYVKGTYNAAAKGPFSKTITVTLSGAEKPVVLTFKGTVI